MIGENKMRQLLFFMAIGMVTTLLGFPLVENGKTSFKNVAILCLVLFIADYIEKIIKKAGN